MKSGAVDARLLLLALPALLLQWGCGTQRATLPPQHEPLQDIVFSPPGDRGNPPFYEVLGRRYYVLESSAGYRERGTASWYGKEFHGLSTAGGEIYDMYGLTAAHKTLPIPTWVEVTNLDNGRRVIVKVNDRGPFVGERIIDLSYAAAQALDMLRRGTAPVEVRALGAAASGPITAQSDASARGLTLINEAAAATPGPGDRPMRPLFIQVGAFSERGNADAMVDRLHASGYGQAFVASEGRGAGALHRVRIGPFATVADYDRALEGLRAIGIGDTHLVVGPR